MEIRQAIAGKSNARGTERSWQRPPPLNCTDNVKIVACCSHIFWNISLDVGLSPRVPLGFSVLESIARGSRISGIVINLQTAETCGVSNIIRSNGVSKGVPDDPYAIEIIFGFTSKYCFKASIDFLYQIAI
jgi:hypothetical protein